MRNIYIDECLLVAQVKGRQREIERRHLLKHVPAPRHHLLSRLISRLGAGLIVLGTRMQQRDQRWTAGL
jgi:hypothetical protein